MFRAYSGGGSCQKKDIFIYFNERRNRGRLNQQPLPSAAVFENWWSNTVSKNDLTPPDAETVPEDILASR